MKDTVVFSALKNSGGYFDDGSYMTGYDKFLSNFEDAFDLSTGIFTAPKSGAYLFSASTTYSGSGEHYMSVEKNNQNMMHFYAYNKKGYDDDDALRFDFILTLQKSDSVRLKIEKGNFGCSWRDACMFSGYFIRNT